jgi:transcriptional regulator with XRE-family HTH domain
MGALTDRARAEIRRLSDDRQFSQRRVAETLNVKPSTVTHTINRQHQPITLDFLEAVSDAAQIPAAELIAEPGSLHQLNAQEAALLRALRNWPDSVTRALVQFVAFFADEPSAVRQTRNMHELWRHLDQRKRDQLFGIAAGLAEGFAPDITAKLFEQLSDEAKAAVGKMEKRRRRREA